MHSSAGPRVAFIGWNPFQFLHYRPVAELLPGAAYVIEERPRAKDVHDFSPLRNGGIPTVTRSRRQMRTIDKEYDVLVCQTPFSGIEEIESSAIAMLQYGYAKEAHNFAPWRAFADLCLTYGNYASRKIDPYCPCTASGNPRRDGWENPASKAAALARYGGRLDPAKPVLLYAPTWGALSSFERYAAAIQNLAADYNVILKIHHNTQLAGTAFADAAHRRFGMACGAWDDIFPLLALADVVLSDFSGAIFDALECRVPVILLDPQNARDSENSISDLHSLERVRRGELGRIVRNPDELAAAVRAAPQAPSPDLLEDLFIDATGAARRAADAISTLASLRPPRTQTQEYLRTEMRNHAKCRAELSAARTISGFVRMVKTIITPRRQTG